MGILCIVLLYWVGKTKAWIIPGTEDLIPYIYGKSLISKWVVTLVGYPVIAAVLSLIMSLFMYDQTQKIKTVHSTGGFDFI